LYRISRGSRQLLSWSNVSMFLLDPKIHYHHHKSPLLDLNTSLIQFVSSKHISQHSTSILSFYLWLCCPLLLRFANQNVAWLLVSTMHATCSTHFNNSIIECKFNFDPHRSITTTTEKEYKILIDFSNILSETFLSMMYM